jgi:general secretion pathway protein G
MISRYDFAMINAPRSPRLRTPGTARRPLGFTLVELLVVLAILALLAGIVGPKVLGQLGGAKSKTLELFKLDVGRYPTAEEGLEALVKKPPAAAAWAGPYLKGSVPVDPWSHPYLYKPGPGGSIEIMSLGADGQPGGEGENSDIRNKQ